MPVQSYIVLLVTDPENPFRNFDCQLRITKQPYTEKKDYAVIGINFLQNYLQVYDMVTN